MPLPGAGPKLFKLVRFTWLMQFFRREREEKVQEHEATSISRKHAISPRGIDLDSIEDMMNRRMRMIWMRHTWFVIILGTVVFAGLIGLTIFYSVKPTELRVAVGPAGSDDVKFVEKLQARLAAEHNALRVKPTLMKEPVTVTDIHAAPAFDLAVVRGNMALSNDWPVVAILRQNVVALIVPPESARAPIKTATPPPPVPPKGKRAKAKAAKVATAKAAKAKDDDDKDDDKKKSELKVGGLAGKTIGIVTSTDGGPELLDVILKHYGVPKDKVKTVQLAQADLKSAIYDRKIDVALVAGPQTSKVIEDAVAAASSATEGPTFVEIDQAEGIGKRTPPYDSIEIPAGAFGGVPPQPDDKLTTLAYPLYLVARRTYNEDKIAQFSKFLYNSRQALAYEVPGAIAIESPSTDKDAAVVVHPGTAAYLGDNLKTVFDKYGDQIFYGLLIFPVLGSALAGVAGYFRADKNTQRIRQLHRLLQLVKRARTLTSLDELDKLQDEADSILGETIQQSERGALDEMGLATFSLAIDQARHALSEQRSMLVLRPENVPRHGLPGKGPSVAAAE
jgi:hypothetical protein